ncbi:hypothetical protein TW95_gp1138 [Pandoravirus inopinatum]|uniref:Uncharacterized protein n=1 Tax=Pandoravirus inopinatum TaxID=1605721 RepID=A0A0B5JDR0_9VIRU|nr:hypothetical protein TW95_gp1138 [Pandoravirus inopinatum]AJF97872.1 hypothetical protein [Pandoravirus inopinatum]
MPACIGHLPETDEKKRESRSAKCGRPMHKEHGDSSPVAWRAAKMSAPKKQGEQHGRAASQIVEAESDSRAPTVHETIFFFRLLFVFSARNGRRRPGHHHL